MLRVGIWASCIGIVVSMLLLIIEFSRLAVSLPQNAASGSSRHPDAGRHRTAWVSAIDMVSLLAEICTLVGELLVVAFTLWLLFAVLKHIGVFGRLDEPATARRRNGKRSRTEVTRGINRSTESNRSCLRPNEPYAVGG